MKSRTIREKFLKFFESKQHLIVDSAPLVVKNDPTLMFINAGMNPFKDYFLGNKEPIAQRIADTQKCLRVSGKHNDLEEVGVDTYHHTMFEMLGNWSFGDYFKEDAIDWAWELIVDVYQINPENLYATVFEGSKDDGLDRDQEAFDLWKKFLPEGRILNGSKKDNFWEMGENGPCGPCSELHIDLRSEEDKAKIPGRNLVNMDHPEVIEIWNLVFIQFNRKKDNSLINLPNKHVDTGMGFERLSMVLQGKTSSYDTDVFQPIIQELEKITGFSYGKKLETDIALRVIADHIRALFFAIVDGQLPASNKGGYVIRRILRRAVRYAYTHLDYPKPLLYQLLPILEKQFSGIFPGVSESIDFAANVIKNEEESFLRTLESGIKRFSDIKQKAISSNQNTIPGKDAFELFDTYGFPIDLTELMARESKMKVDLETFKIELEKQKTRSREATKMESGDWITVHAGDGTFVGYDHLEVVTKVLKVRSTKQKDKLIHHLVLEETPFYAESGGQVGDKGYLEIDGKKYSVFDTKKENELIVHFLKEVPENFPDRIKAVVNGKNRKEISSNHSATHLLHSSLKKHLGLHVNQKGSMVHPDYLRFDFAHFSKVSDEELALVEELVNEKIRSNIPLEERRLVPYDQAVSEGATALFGEKYADDVRVIAFDREFSMELCGGTHVNATGEIGFFKIIGESAVAAGVRRIEAISGPKAYKYIQDKMASLQKVQEILKRPKNLVDSLSSLVEENNSLKKDLERMQMIQAGQIKNQLVNQKVAVADVQLIKAEVQVENADMVKKIAFDLKKEVPDLFLILGAKLNGKAHLTIMMDEEVATKKKLDANQIIRQVSKQIQGGGGGQKYYATAGGKNPDGLHQAMKEAEEILRSIA